MAQFTLLRLQLQSTVQRTRLYTNRTTYLLAAITAYIE